MSKLLWLLAVITLTPLIALAQGDANKLTIPSSPAFSILNFEPTAVMRPTSNKDLATDVLSSFDKNGKLLMNLGLEVSPYWLQSKPTLTREQYLNPTLFQAVKQSFSLSAGTVKDSASGANKFGAGFRFKLLNGRPSPDLEKTEQRLIDTATIQADIALLRAQASMFESVSAAIAHLQKTMLEQGFAADVVAGIISYARDLAPQFPNTTSGIRAFAEALNNDIESKKGDLVKQVTTLTKQRLGFILELAGATAYNTSTGDDLERLGVWVNASNYVSATDLFTLTARYMYHNGDTVTGNADVGLSYMKQAEKYNVSIEYMLRWYQAEIADVNSSGQPIKRLEKNSSYRLAVQGSYLISQQISVNVSFGKNFDSPFISGSGFFSILGLNYSIFNKEHVAN